MKVSLSRKYLDNLFEFSSEIVKKSSEITLKYFKPGGIKSELKKDNSPVTAADLKCDDFLIKKIKSKYPSHDILTEESDACENGSEFRWIIDPVDGTRNFMRGYPFWGTLLALEYQSNIIIGIISMPALKTFIYAVKGKGCYYNTRRCKVSTINRIENSYMHYSSLKHILNGEYKTNFLKLASKCEYTRGFGDCHGHSFIISGSAEIMIDPVVAPYDIAPTKICIEEAGGKLTDFHGIDSIYNKNAVISNRFIHDEVLEILNSD